MNKTLNFFNYESCFIHYTEQIMNIRQAKINGEIIVAKPVLMLSLLQVSLLVCIPMQMNDCTLHC